MSADVIAFPLHRRLDAVAASFAHVSGPVSNADVRRRLQTAMASCWSAHHGDDVDLNALRDLDDAVRSPAWDDANAAVIRRVLACGGDWLAQARHDAHQAANADRRAGWSYAATREHSLEQACGVVSATLTWLDRRSLPGEPPRDPLQSTWGLLDLEWPDDAA